MLAVSRQRLGRHEEVTCADKRGKIAAFFEVNDFARCLENSCTGDDVGIEAAMATLFEKKMVGATELGASFDCVISAVKGLSLGKGG
jgi:hypothetical protein